MAESPLFRPAVLQAREPRRGVPVPWSAPRDRAWMWLLGALLAAGCVSLLFVGYAEKLTVRGVVEALTRPVPVLGGETGVIERVRVADGDTVAPGDVLVLVDAGVYAGAGETLAERAALALEQRIAMLVREARMLEALDESALAQDAARRQRMQKALDFAEERTRLAGEQLGIVSERLRRARRLAAAGHAAKTELTSLERESLAAQEGLVARREEAQGVAAELEAFESSIDLRRQERVVERHRLERGVAAARAELDALRRSRRIALVAPVAGRVTNLVAAAGQPVDAGRPLLTLVPGNDGHVVALHVPGSALARVRLGIAVQLRYDGFAVQEHGLVAGRVSSIGQAPIAVSGQVPVYRVEVAVASPPAFAVSGVLVEADLRGVERPIWRWLAQPFADALARI